jgi:O-antigen ligase
MVVPTSYPQPFLQKKLNFLITLLVVATTIFSKFNLNSWCIILLVLCRLADGGPVRAIKAAFSNRYFLAFLALFLLDVAGLLFSHNQNAATRVMEKSATLLAVSFVLCGGTFTDDLGYKKFMTFYCGLVFVACVYCIVKACGHFLVKHDISVFFYHPLSQPIGQNAVFFSVYMIFGLLYLLSHQIQTGGLAPTIRKPLQFFLIAFFAGFIILLSSKLLLVVLFLILVSYILQRYIARRNYAVIMLVSATGLSVVLWLVLADNPIKRRYQDLERGDLSLIKANKFTPSTNFNGAQLRLLQWRYANQILRENNAWIFGVSPGDSQDLLNEKYKKAEVDTGIPNSKQKGFLDYNFHNQYIETTVKSGIVGLAILLTVCWLFILIVRDRQTPESFFTILTLLLILAVESFLTLQDGIFAFVFIPLMLLYSPRRKEIVQKQRAG